MRIHLRFLSITSLLLVGCSVNPQKEVARKAAIAMTGSPETLTAIVSLTMEGRGQDAGQQVSAFSRVISFRKERLRQEVTIGTRTLISGVDGKLAYHIESDTGPVRDSAEIAAAHIDQIYHHPVAFLLACFSGNPQLSGTRVVAGQDAMDLTVGGIVYSLFLDPKTNLPTRILSNQGGHLSESIFTGYRKVQGYTLPYQIVETRDGSVAKWEITRQFPGPDLPGLTDPLR